MRIIRALFPLLTAFALAVLSPASRAQILVRIDVAPPPIPIYVQPVIPGPDYIWVPGYWAWGPDGYFWVPGTWVLAPAPGLLWTPGYWAWVDGVYIWHAGYWGPHIGFYGGVNYGCGYTGVGYQGGYWRGGVFVYNRAIVNLGSVHITNVYYKTVVTNNRVTNVSFNGGAAGTKAQPNPQELAAANEKHIPATNVQSQHEHAASSNHALLASSNHGMPAVAATAMAGHFSGHGVVAAKAISLPQKSATTGNLGPRPAGAIQQRQLQMKSGQFTGQGAGAMKGSNPVRNKPQGSFPARTGGQSNFKPPPRPIKRPDHPPHHAGHP